MKKITMLNAFCSSYKMFIIWVKIKRLENLKTILVKMEEESPSTTIFQFMRPTHKQL